MKLTSLSLANVRAIEEVTFTFNPGFNLIIGINGAGKSTALDAIRYCGSHVLTAIQKMPFKASGFSTEDIHGNAPFSEATLRLSFTGSENSFVRLREWREHVAVDSTQNTDQLRREIMETTRPRDRLRNQLRELQEPLSASQPVFFYPSRNQFKASARDESSAPLIVYYSTSRSIMNEQAERKFAANTQQLAYVNALHSNALSLRQFADWMRAQIELSSESETSLRLVASINGTLQRFLPGYSHIRPSASNMKGVEVDFNGATLDVRQLSDGERSVLALVLDVSKRLAQANPALADPFRTGEAIILIDEIDLHLHPKWQRSIVRNLEQTFPSCQIIATTHSPQVVGEVAHDKIQVIEDGNVFTPARSFGIDSSRVLEEIMGSVSRDPSVTRQIGKVAKLIASRDFEQARTAIQVLSDQIGPGDPEITRAQTLLNFMDEDP